MDKFTFLGAAHISMIEDLYDKFLEGASRDDKISLAQLLNTHCPNIECTPSVAVEMLAKSAIDPGSSSLHYSLLNVKSSDTQYSLMIDNLNAELTVESLFPHLKKRYKATLIAVKNTSNNMVLNPPLTMTVSNGDTLYYIASKRIHNVDWEAVC